MQPSLGKVIKEMQKYLDGQTSPLYRVIFTAILVIAQEVMKLKQNEMGH